MAYRFRAGADLKTLKEAAKIIIAGTEGRPHPRATSKSQQSAITHCVCGRPHTSESNTQGCEGTSRTNNSQHMVERIERELDELGERRIELAKEIGDVMRLETKLRQELKSLKDRG